MGKFDNKVVVITGSGQGIGRCLALTYAKEGAHVVIVELDAEAGEEVAQMISGPECLFVKTDIGDENSVINLFERVKEKFGKVDILINNAVHGTWMCDIMDEKSIEIFEKVISVNIKGTYMMIKYCLPLMLRPKHDAPDEYLPGPNIINIGSTRSLMSEPNTEPYTASKGAMTSLTHALAVSLSKYRIRVNCVSPGWIDVSNWKKSAVAKQAEIKKEDHQQHPVGRVGVPEDIASACMYFSHEEAGFVTGQNLFVDGGMTKKMIYLE